METSWKDQNISNNFEEYKDILEWTLGYPFVFEWLELNRPGCKSILDYGCGPCKVAQQLAQQYQKKVIAVDESEAMLEIAKKKRNYSLIEYRHIENDELTFISDDSVDGAMLCFVLLNLGNEKQIRKILSEIYRVLAPGSPCVILDTNPSSIGIRFSTFQSGDSTRAYNYGDKREAWLFLPNGTSLELHGYHWPNKTYTDALLLAGFKNIEYQSPTLNDVSEKVLNIYQQSVNKPGQWAEQKHPPYILFRGIK
jgi:ubiquinone/menaquinone biosynthesis C-methylase UbiE